MPSQWRRLAVALVASALVALGIWRGWPAQEAPEVGSLEKRDQTDPAGQEEEIAGDADSAPVAPGSTPESIPSTKGGRKPGDPPGLLPAAPARDKAADLDIVGYLEVHVSLPDGSPGAGAFVDCVAQEKPRPGTGGFLTGSDGHSIRTTGREGTALVAVKYLQKLDNEASWIEFHVELDGYIQWERYFTWDEIWGRVVPIEVVLERGQEIEVILENVKPGYLERNDRLGKLEVSFSHPDEEGKPFVYLGSVQPTKDRIAVRGVDARRSLHYRAYDNGAYHKYVSVTLEPPLPARIVIHLEQRPDMAAMLFQDWLLDLLKMGNNENQPHLVFYDLATASRVEPAGKAYWGTDDKPESERSWKGYRFPGGEYAIFLVRPATDGAMAPYDDRRYILRPGEEVKVSLSRNRAATRAVLEFVDPVGKPIPKVEYHVYGRLEGVGQPFRLYGREDATEDGKLDLLALPPGGRIVITTRGYEEREIELPTRRGDVLETRIVLSPETD